MAAMVKEIRVFQPVENGGLSMLIPSGFQPSFLLVKNS
jgi:hypothetical protein